ncbi:hypothetical protein [Catenulispora subtropica]|uniref:Lipoprotein n=1 Tax=Catenulispora subtropica TaxID=450798 RepID=A0ABP5C4B7_9ACTN
MKKALIIVGGLAAVTAAIYLVLLVVGLGEQNDADTKNKAAADAEIVAAAHTYAERLNAALRTSPQSFEKMAALAPQGTSVTVGARSAPGELTLTFDVSKTYAGPGFGGVTAHCYSEVLVTGTVVSPAKLTEIACSQMMPVVGLGKVVTAP